MKFGEKSDNSYDLDDETDISEIFSLIIKNKKFISFFAILGIIFSIFISLSIKRTWKGTFQIVLKNENGQLDPVSLKEGKLRKLISGPGQDALETEIEILKSPLILLETLKFIQREKISKNDFSLEDIQFEKWRNDVLNIKLGDNTSVLNVSYFDNDKDLIVPALEKISLSYQQYSGRSRLRELELSDDFYKKQLIIYRKKSEDSLEKAQEYAISKNLTLPINLFDNSEIEEGNNMSLLGIEKARIEASTKIKIIDDKLKQLDSINKPDDIYLFTTLVNDSSLMPIFSEVIEKDSTLSELATIFTDSDLRIKDLKKERELAFKSFKKQLKGYLESQKENQISILKASSRPKGVISKYIQLLVQAKKDQATLVSLEKEYRLNSLEKVRKQDPWELITKPYVLKYPVAPKRRLFVLYGLITGFVTGIAIVLIKDKNRDLIKSSIKVNKLTGWPLVSEISLNNKNLWDLKAKKISENLNKTKTSIGFLLAFENDKLIFQNIFDKFKIYLNDQNFIITKNIQEVSLFDTVFIVVHKQQTRRDELIKIKKDFYIQEKDIKGYIFIDTANDNE